MANVTVIRKKKQAVLVQWVDVQGELKRGTVPAGAVHGGTVDDETLAMAIPAGFPWAEIVRDGIDPEAIPGEIERRLHRVGIWDLADLLKMPNAAVGAIQAAYKLDLSALTKAARRFEK